MYSRQPQFELSYYHKTNRISFFASTHLETASDGPIGVSTSYLHNNIIPDLCVRWISQHPDGHLLSIGCDILRIVPRLTTMTGQDTHAHVTGIRCIRDQNKKRVHIVEPQRAF